MRQKLQFWIVTIGLMVLLIGLTKIMAQTPAPLTMEWKIDGDIRQALVYIPGPSSPRPRPVIFAFHGHGGNMKNIYNSRRFHELWPEAIFVCPQGLNTPGLLTDPEGKLPGWQNVEGKMNNRDLKFFDAMMRTLLDQYPVDQKRIYVTGHSNGGGFTYLLWAVRGEQLAAVAPTATVGGKNIMLLKPKPVLHLYGEKDNLVKTAWQEKTCDALLKLNDCNAGQGILITPNVTKYTSKNSNPVLIYKHPGGHNYPLAANQVIIDFFKSINAGS